MKRITRSILGLAAGALALGGVSIGTAAANDEEYNARYDFNRDGIIDREEHEVMHYDADGDGRLDAREYEAMHVDAERHTPVYDRDDPYDRHGHDSWQFRRARTQADHWFRTLDRNRDNYISFREARRSRGAWRQFAAADINDDRLVNYRELVTYLANGRRPVRYAQPYGGYYGDDRYDAGYGRDDDGYGRYDDDRYYDHDRTPAPRARSRWSWQWRWNN